MLKSTGTEDSRFLKFAPPAKDSSSNFFICVPGALLSIFLRSEADISWKNKSESAKREDGEVLRMRFRHNL
jgi:hypothetical protein